jgi:hypothetical protein
MPQEKDKTGSRTNQILQEIRIVLPGTQALLGFQFIAFFNPSFKTLSSHLQMYHLINLLLVTCSTVLLIAPVAYQEILENGHNTERFLRFTSRVITLAMLFLLLGLAGDIFVAGSFLKLAGNTIPMIAAISMGIFGFAMWFGITNIKRRHR